MDICLSTYLQLGSVLVCSTVSMVSLGSEPVLTLSGDSTDLSSVDGKVAHRDGGMAIFDCQCPGEGVGGDDCAGRDEVCMSGGGGGR